MKYLFNRRTLPCVLACWLAFANAFTNLGALLGDTPRKPNVLFILADDLGWSDTTLYGTTNYYRTPNSATIIQSSDYYPTLLELLNIDPQPGQKFDGISILPALLGKHLEREAIFTYFPHNPPVPEWMPASVSVRNGDWKLIRIFHGGEAGQHRFKLFNLKDDIGEQRDLSAHHSERVQQLNSLIDKFLVDTGAVLPIVNPNFDPTKYHSELEGKAKLKQNSKDNAKGDIAGQESKQSALTPESSQPVAGWKAAGTCDLEVNDGVLIVTSTGGDPHLSFTLPAPVTESPLVLHLSMSSAASGGAQIFWQEREMRPAFHRDRSQTFEVKHD